MQNINYKCGIAKDKAAENYRWISDTHQIRIWVYEAWWYK